VFGKYERLAARRGHKARVLSGGERRLLEISRALVMEPDVLLEGAMDLIYGYGVGLDMTRRDLQGEAKKMGRPWEVGKAFEASAPCTALKPASEIGHPAKGSVWLDVNGERSQTGDLDQMIWKVPEMIAYLSRLFTLASGDLIDSGTPSGVGAITRGDRLHGHVDGIGDLEVEVV
jgi:fumarylpyruvate hydrolase